MSISMWVPNLSFRKLRHCRQFRSGSEPNRRCQRRRPKNALQAASNHIPPGRHNPDTNRWSSMAPHFAKSRSHFQVSSLPSSSRATPANIPRSRREEPLLPSSQQKHFLAHCSPEETNNNKKIPRFIISESHPKESTLKNFCLAEGTIDLGKA